MTEADATAAAEEAQSYGGQNTGNFRVLDALSTLAFDFPEAHPQAAARKAFFQSELEEYLALTARTKTDPLALRGSYAGAMGWPQFMPSSYRKYAVDFDGDGQRNLWSNVADVIGSVANYYKLHEWQAGEAVVVPAQVGAELAALTERGVLTDAPRLSVRASTRLTFS